MPNEMVEVNKCMVCGSDTIISAGTYNSRPSMKVDLGYTVLPVIARVSYSQCLMCGMIWQNPRMSDKDLNEYYSKGHYRQYLSATVESMDEDEILRAKRIVEELDMIPTRHLDIGCSRGFLLRGTKTAFGCGIQGVDSNPSYAVDNIPVVDDISLVWGTFDLITMIHVLEHTTDPIKELQRVKPFLSKEGTLIIEVPSHKSTGSPWRLAHTLHMEPWVLTNICMIAGYAVKDIALEEHTRIQVTI
jgi:cyclopropane fatty-acyl-phospholipid synthase-like methyltransferase